ncbi:MAG: hypothetical protein QNI90_01875 [Dinoroseobacter sp.]|nr:hypothetical protein [Dinoroseobacter sp.]
MKRTKRLLCAAALMTTPLTTEAATVNPFEMAFFSFDTSGLNALQLTGSAFACIFSSQCFEADGTLAPGSQLRVDYGTTQGGTELGSRFFTNSFSTPINNAAGNVATSPTVFVPAETETLYATFGFVDDAYMVEEFTVFTTGGALGGSALPSEQTTSVPLSATGWMLLLGVSTLGVLGHRTQRKRSLSEA